MRSVAPPFVDGTGQRVAELIHLLHQGAPADDFARRLAEVEALPDDIAAKSMLAETVRMAMAIRNRLELQQQRERGMLAVIDSAQALSSRLDLQSLLAALVQRARNLLGSDIAWLSIYDTNRGEFHVLAADGAMQQTTSGMVARHDRGVASVVMSTRLPFMTPDYLHDARFEHDAALDAAFQDEGIAALVGVPLVWDGEVTGLLFVADRYHRLHTAQSIAILCTLATHGAVALKNARDFERANAALRDADQARAELERHVRSIQAATDAHEQLTSLLARGASLSTLCESVARLLGGSVLVLDEASQAVSAAAAPGYAGPGASAHAPHGPRSAEVARALRQSRETGRSVLAWQQDDESCRVMPVIGGDDLLGAALLFHGGTLEEIAIRTFERSASVIGVVLLSRQRLEASKSHDASDLLRSLVWPRQGELTELMGRADHHGVDLSRPLALMLVEVDGPSAGYAARRFRTTRPLANALVDDLDGTLVILCGATGALDARQAVSAWARGELRATHRGVLSRPIGGPAEVPALYATLGRALPVLRRIGVQGQIVNQNELALYSTLFETHDHGSLDSFLQATIGPLISLDRKRSAELAPTLLCYFDHNQNAKTTAQRLGIHVNTVRQRLATIETLLGHWGQASRALEIHIALRLWHLSAPSA
ncbi:MULTISPECIES: helix-turn-helix domain-containing protein [unclassified Rhizobacter]|uniref:helix-turn-helix domain-containing protein n=1 Tax=unclassified Rhizobacter TaxID=2640088 RepID=UPI0006FB16B0|nr:MULTISPECIES: helix-turn-helix domain-containing protein [unclassified Rhizobacter]KQU64566.1 CdaR family transcriptional regulator [Rhizobacter sp. Root29]KQW03384.1 CdaR family transcriptional regulator [Rhizobacter sp. Root1238]KRB13716.1 CdaR family transcriptional regulator [Rhizobacter sp. Root16D2]